MEWDSESDGAGSVGTGEEEQEQEDEEEEERGGEGGGGDAGGMFTFAIEGMLRASGPCGLVVTDALEPNCPIIYVNRGFEEATGYRTEEVLGRNCGRKRETGQGMYTRMMNSWGSSATFAASSLMRLFLPEALTMIQVPT